MNGKLPSLSGDDAAALFQRFAREHRKKGNKVVGIGREGRPFTVDLVHGGLGMRSDILRSALKYLGVSRPEFWEWYRSR